MEAAYKGADVVNVEHVAEEVDEVEGVEPAKAEEAEPTPNLEYELGLARAEVEEWEGQATCASRRNGTPTAAA